jgi:hypothetical protein
MFDYTLHTPHSQHVFGRDQFHGDSAARGNRRRPGSDNPWTQTERDPSSRRAAVVKFASTEDAFLAWRSCHDQQHSFSADSAPKLIKCRVLE